MPAHSRGQACCFPAQCKQRTINSAASMSLLALLLIATKIGPSSSLVSPIITQHVHDRTLTQRNYRGTGMAEVESFAVDSEAAAAAAAVSLLTVANPFTSPPSSEKMPVWLRPRGHLADDNLKALKDVMAKSYLSESQASKVLYAIEEAAGGDPNKVAGAAEFCHILVETMEMGVDALVAAAFHYCTAVTAREQSSLLPPAAFSSSSFWEECQHHHNGVESFGDQAVRIVKDAATLKKLETVAASVVRNARSERASPDSHDSQNLLSLLLTETRDWRALAIRTAASLFRLRGLLAVRGERLGSAHSPLSPEEVRVSREALHIYAPLASRLGMHRLKNEIEGAAFRLLYRRQYETVTSLALETRRRWAGRTMDDTSTSVSIGEGMQHVLNDVTVRVGEVLRNDPTFCSYAENVLVSARVKEPFSLWKKMLRMGARHVLEVPDALALRIIVDGKKMAPDEDIKVTRARERALCYYAQRLCTDHWRPNTSNPRFKDYIERPKPNGYQSLHYIANTHWGGEHWQFEVQVRSGEMHQVAEYGLAAHWDYKSGATNENDSHHTLDQSSEAYLKFVQEWHGQQQGANVNSNSIHPSAEDLAMFGNDDYYVGYHLEEQNKLRSERVRARAERLAPYIEALTAAQSDLARENVFVFLSPLSSRDSESTHGKVLALPSGACVLDALREAERRFGLSLEWEGEGFVHNGVLSSVTTKLRNGDVLAVPLRQPQFAPMP